MLRSDASLKPTVKPQTSSTLTSSTNVEKETTKSVQPSRSKTDLKQSSTKSNIDLKASTKIKTDSKQLSTKYTDQKTMDLLRKSTRYTELGKLTTYTDHSKSTTSLNVILNNNNEGTHTSVSFIKPKSSILLHLEDIPFVDDDTKMGYHCI